MEFIAKSKLKMNMDAMVSMASMLILEVGYKELTPARIKYFNADIERAVGKTELKKLTQWLITESLFNFYTLMTLIEDGDEYAGLLRLEKAQVMQYILSQPALCKKLDKLDNECKQMEAAEAMADDEKSGDEEERELTKMAERLRKAGYTVKKNSDPLIQGWADIDKAAA